MDTVWTYSYDLLQSQVQSSLLSEAVFANWIVGLLLKRQELRCPKKGVISKNNKIRGKLNNSLYSIIAEITKLRKVFLLSTIISNN